MQRLARGREKIDIFSRRLFRRAGRPAKDAGRADADEEDSLEGRVAIDQRAIHRIGGRKQLGHFHWGRVIDYQRRPFDGKARCFHERR